VHFERRQATASIASFDASTYIQPIDVFANGKEAGRLGNRLSIVKGIAHLQIDYSRGAASEANA
jgi:hypothetical protein